MTRELDRGKGNKTKKHEREMRKKKGEFKKVTNEREKRDRCPV